MRFKKGQQVVCIQRAGWMHVDTHQENPNAPKYNEIVTVHSEDPEHPGFICFEEYDHSTDGDSFVETNFEPVVDISELKEILEHQPETV